MKILHYKYSILLFLLMSPLFFTPSGDALLTEISNTTEAIRLPRKINIALWGFDSNRNTIQNTLTNNLPSSIILESETGYKENTGFYPYLANSYYHYKYEISYNFQLNPNGISSISDLINHLNATSNGYNSQGITNDTTYNGWSINIKSFSSYLDQSIMNDFATIHLIDFSSLDNILGEGKYHWYRDGITESITNLQQDMRNLGLVGDNGIFFDPTAIAPRFDDNEALIDQIGSVPWLEYIISRISDIVENLIISSPASTDLQIALEQKIHFLQILLADNTNNGLANDVKNHMYGYNLQYALEELFPYSEIEFKQSSISLNSYYRIRSYLDQKTKILDDKPTIIVDQQFSSDMKYLIRNEKTIYQTFPSGYFYPIFIFANEDGPRFVHEENHTVIYEAGNIGFALLNIKELKDSSDPNYILKEQMRVFGKNFGIAKLEGFISQIESSMSTYGVTSDWSRKYNSLEIDAFYIRMGADYNKTANSEIHNYRNSIDDSVFSGLNTTGLDIAALELRKGDIFYSKGNYFNATQAYKKGYNLWLDARDEINQKVINIKNSIKYSILMAMFGYIIYVIFDISIPLEKFKEKYKIEN